MTQKQIGIWRSQKRHARNWTQQPGSTMLFTSVLIEFQTYTCFQNQSTKKGETMDFVASVTCLYFSLYRNSLCNKCDTRKS